MRKLVSVFICGLILLTLGACGSDKEEQIKYNEIKYNIEEDKNAAENINNKKNNKKSIVTIEELPIEIKILEPDSIGTRYMEAAYKNNSEYTIKGLSITVLLKDKNEKTYLSNYGNVLAGETSLKFETFAPESGRAEDYEFLVYEITVMKDENTNIHITYNVKTQEYNWF